MLTSTREKLDALYAGGKHRGTDGKLYQINPNTRVDPEQGKEIAEIHRNLRPFLSVEIGFAYGFSTLHILDAMKEGKYGQHIAIDPWQTKMWHGIGLQAVADAKLNSRFSPRFKWLDERSDYALADMSRTKTYAQLVYIDGSHLFDDVLSDIRLSDRILVPGAIMLMDDTWMPAVRRAVSFLEKNMTWYERFPTRCKNLAAFRRLSNDNRVWDHYVDF